MLLPRLYSLAPGGEKKECEQLNKFYAKRYFACFWLPRDQFESIMKMPFRIVKMGEREAKMKISFRATSFYSNKSEKEGKTSVIDFLQNLHTEKMWEEENFAPVDVISIFAIKLSPHKRENRAGHWQRRIVDENLRFLGFSFINQISPVIGPSRWKRSRICREIVRRLQLPKQSHQATAECECLDAVRTVPMLIPLSSVALSCLFQLSKNEMHDESMAFN